MSRHRRKNLMRGIKQPLGEREQRPRASRHGQPHSRRVRKVVEVKGVLKVVFENVPIMQPYKMRVAAGPTATVGMVNTGGAKAGKKAVKPNDAR